MKKVLILLVILVLTAGFINSTNDLIRSFGSVTPTGPFRVISSLNAYENVYFTVYNTETGQVWNNDSGTFVATDAASVTGANYANIAITCTDSRDQAEDGWVATLPAAMSGQNADFTADIKFYDNATPASTDTILLGKHSYIKATTISGTYLSRFWTWTDL